MTKFKRIKIYIDSASPLESFHSGDGELLVLPKLNNERSSKMRLAISPSDFGKDSGEVVDCPIPPATTLLDDIGKSVVEYRYRAGHHSYRIYDYPASHHAR